MKRKLLCVLFMLAGAAVIAGSILLSRGRSDYADASPAWMLIILSILTIAETFRSVNAERDMYSLPVPEKIFLWIFYTVSVLAMLWGLVFVLVSAKIYTLFFVIIAVLTALAARNFNGEPYWPEVPVIKNGKPYWPEVSVIKKVSRWIFYIVGLLAVPVVLALISGSVNIIYPFIIIIIAAIFAAAWFRYDYGEDEPEAAKRGMVSLGISRAVSVLAIFVCLAFLAVTFFLTGYFDSMISVLHYMLPLAALALAGIAAAALNLKLRAPVAGRGIGRALRCVPAAAALIAAASLCFAYINYMPKYSLDNGLDMLRTNEAFSQEDIFYLEFNHGWGTTATIQRVVIFGSERIEGETSRGVSVVGSFGGNPFYTELFEYNCDSYSCDADGLHVLKGYILFNPATGAYEYTRAQEQDITYSPGDPPIFNYNFICDRDGRYDAALNLFFRERQLHPDTYGTYEDYTVRGSEWDEKIKDVMYPQNFPEDEALLFLRSMGGEALKSKISEIIDWSFPDFKDKTIEVYFFGIDIATYNNGEIVLKI